MKKGSSVYCRTIGRGQENPGDSLTRLSALLPCSGQAGGVSMPPNTVPPCSLQSGQFNEDMIPTVGFNMRKITKGNVTIKLWDIGGQPRFRSMWERYCRGVSAIVYMVDAADQEKIEASKNELHNLLDKPQLQGIPVLVLGNKRDLPGALDEKELIEKMNLSAIQDREICCYSISCKEKDNIGEYGQLQCGAQGAAVGGQPMPTGAVCPGCFPSTRGDEQLEGEAVSVPLPSQTSPYSGLSSTQSLGEAEIPRTAAWIGKMPLYKPMPLLSPALSLQLSL
ncbi:hypothetical protein QYF61_012887 [Mycteria americana]|uniref:ADP-ribosylation factor-like protein 8A n=1 Tax=Mycteria americana TaxID=33587 RepID=A0AAN7MMS1_MYCAM|nr:hypothetical protein QYF61_012887 [Mycteria americana]